MCGRLLVKPSVEEPAQATGNQPMQAPEEKVAQPVEVRQETAEAQPEPVVAGEAAPVAAESAKRSDLWWVDEYKDEGQTTISGPSFLGLGSAKPGESGYSSYLLQEEEEEERSHKTGWVLLLVLLVMGGVMYANWRPIRDYVLPAAISLVRPKPPNHAADPGSATPATPAVAMPAAPTTTVATSDAQALPTSATDIEDQSQAAEAKTGAAKKGLPERDNDSYADSKTGDKRAGKQSEKQQAPAEEDIAADEAKPSAAKRELTTPVNEGSELVSSGEKYLYGHGVARSCDQAVSYFKAAAAKRNPQAFSHLGALYATGRCVPTDRAVAYAWFQRAYAKEPSNRYFEQNLTMLWREMTPDERQRATGRQ
ncbi:MAG: hypothetical protein LAO06_15075 [Acidobacteriia bacterium]|nr:hypothetical protein [Terriglobia bacterium]